MFWQNVYEALPDLRKSKNWYVVSDEEPGFVRNVKHFFPDVLHIRCWNHVLRNVESKLNKLRITNQADIEAYKIDMRKLFSMGSSEDYFKKYFELSVNWHQVNNLLPLHPLALTFFSRTFVYITTKTFTRILNESAFGTFVNLEIPI